MKKILFIFLATSLLAGSAVQASSSETLSKSTRDSGINKEVVLNDVVVTDAMKEFKSLSRVDRKMRIAEAKKALKDYKAQKASGDVSTNTLLLVILAILLPPLAVALHENGINGKFWLDLLLTLLFYLPGLIYALIVVLG